MLRVHRVRAGYAAAVACAVAALAFSAAPALAGCRWVCTNCTLKTDGTMQCETCTWFCDGGGGPAPAEDAS